MSRTPANYTMTAVRGATWEDEFVYTDANGAPVDLTGYEARMQVRTLEGQFGTSAADTLLLELATTGVDPRLSWDTAATGRLLLRVPPAEHLVLNPDNDRKTQVSYGIELYLPAGAQPEYVIPLVQGKVNVLGEVAR